MGLEVGVGLWTMQSTAAHPRQLTAAYRELGADAARVEALGFGSMWTAEHHGWYDGWCPALMEAQAAAVAGTRTLRFGNAILVAPLHEPRRLAGAVRTLDRLSGGRVELGLGQGHREAEFDALGLRRRDRARRLEAALDELEPLGVPILLGGMSDPALARAARRGHSLLLPQTLSPPRVAEAARDYRASGGTGRVGVLRDAWVEADGRRARERFLGPLVRHYREEIGAWWPLKGRWPGFAAPEELERQLARVRAGALVGAPDEVHDGVAELAAAGADLVVLRLGFDFTPAAELHAAMELTSRRVLARLA